MRIKSMAFAAISLLLSIYTCAQVSWVGAGDGVSWSDGANWSAGAVPVAGDNVILDNSVVPGSYDVMLPQDATVVDINSIVITPVNPALIRLLLPASNTANPAIHATSTGDAFVLQAGASFINASGSNIIIDGNFILTGASSANLSSGAGSPKLSIKGNIAIGAANSITESGTGNPTVELNGNHSQTISSIVGGMTGDNLDFIVNTTSTVSLLSSVFLPHGLFVKSGTLDVSNQTDAALPVYVLGVRGDLTVQGTITETGVVIPRIVLNGTTNQNITVSPPGSITGDNLDLRLNNAAGATLLSDLVLPYSYTIAAGNLTLGNFSLTTLFVQPLPSAPVTTNHIITNGTGFLVIPDVVANATFPVGVDATSVNEVYIANGEGLTYSIRVNSGINPPISLPLYAINRTWTINTNSIPANPINVNFYYYAGQGTPNFNYGDAVDIGQYTPSAWSIIKNNLTPGHDGAANVVAALINSFDSPFVVGNHGAILPIDFMVTCRAQKKAGNAVVSWNVGTGDNVSHFEIEKSVNGSGFKAISSVWPEDQKLSYDFTDNSVQGGNSFYRVKVVLSDGKPRYSNIVALVYTGKTMLITSVAPNPVHSSAVLTISLPGNTMMRLALYDVQGKVVRQWQQRFSDGNNVFALQLADLMNGVYFLSGTDGNTRTNVMRIVKQ